MRVSRPRAFIVLCVVAVLTSCNESTAPVPDPELDAALEQLSATQDLAAPGMAMMGVAPVPSAGGPAACPYNAGNKRFECPSVTHNGMTMTRYYQLLDAAGAAQPAWSASVVAIRNVMDASGTLTPPTPNAVPMQMTSHDESTMSGLKSETKTLTGTGTSTFTVTLPQGSTTSSMARTVNLTLPKPAPDVYPTGTITMTMSVSGSSSPTMTMTMTYNGTSKVTMTSTIGGTTRTCIYDQKTPQTPPVCS